MSSVDPEEFDNSSQHHDDDYAQVIDDDDDDETTSGVLETFEICSSNSMSVCQEPPVALDDGSSTDTVKLVNIIPGNKCNKFRFDSSKVYVINDDDDDEDDVVVDNNDDVGDDDDDDVVETFPDEDLDKSNKSNIMKQNQHKVADLSATNDATTLTKYLDTTSMKDNRSDIVNLTRHFEYMEKTDAITPKRLSSEFLIDIPDALLDVPADAEIDADVDADQYDIGGDTSSNCATFGTTSRASPASSLSSSMSISSTMSPLNNSKIGLLTENKNEEDTTNKYKNDLFTLSSVSVKPSSSSSLSTVVTTTTTTKTPTSKTPTTTTVTKNEQQNSSNANNSNKVENNMSFRLKEMTIHQNNNCKNSSSTLPQESSSINATIATSTSSIGSSIAAATTSTTALSQVLLTAPTLGSFSSGIILTDNIETMDSIERKDFETEQRLCGGIVVKCNSIINNKNELNLNLIKQQTLNATVYNVNDDDDDDGDGDNEEDDENDDEEDDDVDDEDNDDVNDANVDNDDENDEDEDDGDIITGNDDNVGIATISDVNENLYKHLKSKTPNYIRSHSSRPTKSSVKVNLTAALCAVDKQKTIRKLDENIKGSVLLENGVGTGCFASTSRQAILKNSNNNAMHHPFVSNNGIETERKQQTIKFKVATNTNTTQQQQNLTSINALEESGCSRTMALKLSSTSTSTSTPLSTSSTLSSSSSLNAMKDSSKSINNRLNTIKTRGTATTSTTTSGSGVASQSKLLATSSLSSSSTSSSNTINNIDFYDVSPSTSSARCHYAPLPKSLQSHFHAAAATATLASPQITDHHRYHHASRSNTKCNILGVTSSSSSSSTSAGTGTASTPINNVKSKLMQSSSSSGRNYRSKNNGNTSDSNSNSDVFVIEDDPQENDVVIENTSTNDGTANTTHVVKNYTIDPFHETEEISSDLEEICTCPRNCGNNANEMQMNDHSLGSSGIKNVDPITLFGGHTKTKQCDNSAHLSSYIQLVSISEDVAATNRSSDAAGLTNSLAMSNTAADGRNLQLQLQRKRKYNECQSRTLDNDNYNLSFCNSPAGGDGNNSIHVDGNCCKRIAYDYNTCPTTSRFPTNQKLDTNNTSPSSLATSTSCMRSNLSFTNPLAIVSSNKRLATTRSLIPSRDNPSPELQIWLTQFQRWSHAERIVAIDSLIENCEPTQVRYMMKVIEPQFQRDFISLLPRELALQVLSYLEPTDLLRAAQTCRSWRFLCDDNLLWKEKCRKAQILIETRTDRPKRGRAGNMPLIASPWKAAYMRQHIIEMNWRSRPIREPKVLKGHDDHVITCLQFSGNRIVSGSDDNTLKVWSAVTGRCLRTLVGHTGGVWSSQMSGNVIISGSTDRTLKVWDMETGLCIHTLLGHTSTVRCMHLHGNKVVSGSRDATLRVWNIESGTCIHVLVGHLAAVRCVQYDGKLIVSGAYDYMVKIWHPERQECLHTLQGHTNRVYSLQFDGVHVVSGSLDTSIRVWDAETGNCKHTLMGHQSLTSGMELRQNILVSGNADSTVKVWDITTGQCLQTLSGPNKHQSAVTCLQFNSRFVVTSSDDGTVKLWDVKTGEFIRNLVALESGGSGGVVWRIRANDTKLICAVGSRNGTEETKLMVLDFDVEEFLKNKKKKKNRKSRNKKKKRNEKTDIFNSL